MDYEKKDFRKLYEDLVKSDWFKRAYHNKSLGECPFDISDLAESEDERIRKEMIRYFTEMKKGGSAALPYDDCIAYLEKQKEQKSTEWSEEDEELTEFEQEVSDIVEYCKEHGEHVAFDYAKRHAKTLLALAKKELCNGCNANLEGYIKGQQDAKRQYDESVAYHFPTMPTTPVFGCDGIRCTNPHMDCINCPRKTTGGFYTTCGTSTSNTSATDGKEHNPSFTD